MDYSKELEKINKRSQEIFQEFLQKTEEIKNQHESVQRLMEESGQGLLPGITPEEELLKQQILQLDTEFFSDLSWKEGLEEESIWHIMMPLMNKFNHEVLIKNLSCRIDPEIESCGSYLPITNTITLRSDKINDVGTIVHEMLHMYDYAYEQCQFLRDFWITRLYFRLQDKITDLNQRCTEHMFRQLVLEKLGHSGHGKLFLLKSLDLDLKLDLPLGEVFGYENTQLDIVSIVKEAISELKNKEDY